MARKLEPQDPTSKIKDLAYMSDAPGEWYEKYFWSGEGEHGMMRIWPYEEDEKPPDQKQGLYRGKKKILPVDMYGSSRICHTNLRAVSGQCRPYSHKLAWCLNAKCEKSHEFYATNSAYAEHDQIRRKHFDQIQKTKKTEPHAAYVCAECDQDDTESSCESHSDEDSYNIVDQELSAADGYDGYASENEISGDSSE